VFLWYTSLAPVSCGVSLALEAAALFLWCASLASVSGCVSLAVEAAAVFLWYASLASVSDGVSLAFEVAALFLWYEGLASIPCGVSLAIKRAIFVTAKDTLPIGTFFWGWHFAIPTVKACAEVCWREYRCVRTERVAIGKNEICGLCKDAGVKTHTHTNTRESAEATKHVKKVAEDGHM
jgi:hypothetical protein